MIEKSESSQYKTPSQIYSQTVTNCTTNVLEELQRKEYFKWTFKIVGWIMINLSQKQCTILLL